MKLIIAGASGLVATEVLRQSLRHKDIKAVVALARKSVAAPPGTSESDATKLRSVVVSDYETYPDDAKKEFVGADACIWTVAITPSKSTRVAFDEVTRVCQKCTMAGFRAMVEARQGNANPSRFRFLYMSGLTAQRDETQKPVVFGDYLLMRGETEKQVLAFAAAQEPKGSVEACVAKPAMVTGHSTLVRSVWGTAMRWTGVIPNVSVEELAAAMIEQVKDGFEKEPLMNDDLKRIGQEILAKQ